MQNRTLTALSCLAELSKQRQNSYPNRLATACQVLVPPPTVLCIMRSYPAAVKAVPVIDVWIIHGRKVTPDINTAPLHTAVTGQLTSASRSGIRRLGRIAGIPAASPPIPSASRTVMRAWAQPAVTRQHFGPIDLVICQLHEYCSVAG